MNIPKRFVIKQGVVTRRTPFVNVLLLALGIVLGPLALLFAAGKGRRDILSAVGGWGGGWVLTVAILSLVVSAHNRADQSRIAAEHDRNLSDLRAHRVEWEDEQVEKREEHKQHEFNAYRAAKEGCVQIARQINEVLSGSEVVGFDLARFVAIAGREVAVRESIDTEPVVSLESKVEDIVSVRHVEEERLVRLKAKIVALRKALAAYKLELAQAKLRTFADTRIAALDFGLLPGRHFMVHEFLTEKGWVKEVRVARSYNRLRELKSDSLAFLNYADKLCNEDEHEEMKLLPDEKQIEAVIADLEAHPFEFEIEWDAEANVRYVRLQNADDQPLVEAQPVFRLDGKDKVYVIETGAFDYLSRKLMEEKATGGTLSQILEEKLSQDKTYDEVAWQARQEELARERARKQREATERKALAAHEKKRNRASWLRDKIRDTEYDRDNTKSGAGATASDIRSKNELNARIGNWKRELKKLEAEGF